MAVALQTQAKAARNPTGHIIMTEPRDIRAIEINLNSGNPYLAVIVWPHRDNQDLCIRNLQPGRTWLSFQSGDRIQVRDDCNLWTSHKVGAIRLFLVWPNDHNGRVVKFADAWLVEWEMAHANYPGQPNPERH